MTKGKVIRNSVSKSLNKQLLRYERECMTELEELEQMLSVDPTDEAVEVYVKYYKFMIRDDRLLNALLALSENERAVVLLNIYGELPLGEVSEELGIKYSTVNPADGVIQMVKKKTQCGEGTE